MTIPTFVARWQPPPAGTVMRRPVLLPPTTRPPEDDPFDGVVYDVCRACGWRFGNRPTRCYCTSSSPRRARSGGTPHWTEKGDL